MDFLINVLKDHEKSLDTLITRAEDVIDDTPQPQIFAQNPPPMKIILHEWTEFKNRAIKAELLCFDMKDSIFICNAITKNKIYIFSEKTPDVEIVTDDQNDLLMKGLKIDNLEEEMHSIIGKLDIGLNLIATKVKRSKNEKHSLLHDIDSHYTKNWLSREIGIHHDFIVHGIVN